MPSEPERRVTRNKRHARVEFAESAGDRVTTPPHSQQAIKVSKPTTIKLLFLAANPADTDPLKLEREIEIIREKVRETAFGNHFEITQQPRVRADQLQDFLLKYRPDIVHFSGHGSCDSELVLENISSESRQVSVKALSNLFSLLRQNTRFVVLNACYSERQAQAIAEHIEWVIGMSKAIDDAAAIDFAGSFYQALGYGYGVRSAFELACNQLDLIGLGEKDTPKLKGAKTKANVFPCSNKLARDLLSRSDRKRLQAAQELTAIPQPHLTSLLIHRSSVDPDATVRHWLNRALGKVCSAPAIAALRKNLGDPEPFARLGAKDALEECEAD